ncbi:GAF domain-containing protein [Modestobacter sp. VKM Ac-2986]|uniref:GAF domain-containing protein n=1 Tax=Modestobacter sp. VKM Ac-2986 TaxID=3004140 RepID=UPI0022AA55A3|nr:GAF domain-containing protein [Modestobacter sp. VKM Ac-2986]MCZ2827267.1 GAF domain-containing protein [Modestobacter sp. VKM Ac-2986]
MDLAREFAAQVTAAELELPGPELLPDRLARACAAVLPVDGVGLSVYFSAERRLPLGSSDPTAATAERLQFTLGEGPCLSAHATGMPVLADEAELRARWPSYHDVLVAHTPVRGVISLPLHGGLQDVGALDMYLHAPGDVRALGLADSLTVTAALSDAFAAAMAAEPHTEDGPAWLDAPGAGRRAQVWQAVGFVNVGLGLPSPDALALLRGWAYGHDAVLDDVAEAVLERRLTLEELAMTTGTSAS